MKKLFGLLGFPVSHSLSPYIYEKIFSFLNFNSNYSLLEVNPKNFNNFFEMFPNLSGFNVTMPFKNLMFEKIEQHDQISLKFKTTNLVIKKDYDALILTKNLPHIFGGDFSFFPMLQSRQKSSHILPNLLRSEILV